MCCNWIRGNAYRGFAAVQMSHTQDAAHRMHALGASCNAWVSLVCVHVAHVWHAVHLNQNVLAHIAKVPHLARRERAPWFCNAADVAHQQCSTKHARMRARTARSFSSSVILVLFDPLSVSLSSVADSRCMSARICVSFAFT